MKQIRNYEEQVYAGVLGKIIGVYLGRPIEGKSKQSIEERWGAITRYVHEDQNVPLVVADDDISGTLTFIRALEDSGQFARTPVEFFGQTWLNYLIPNQTVLWWGGLGCSTEHTAYLRLKQGLPAPRSGSIAVNGRTVAEQIGAQIFIDAFGLVAPGRPELAAALARRSASVSHDGEAVNAAVVVAGMISAAFVEKDMRKLLDIGIRLVPRDALIARVHRDVRAWARQDRDRRKTFERIDKKYGYHKYGGNCHVVPNHAIMVMAWCYAPDDFYQAQVIINTAGWDTDCNAANVGALMGVKVGLARINERYDFQSPFADRILLPTAEGTRGVTDVLHEAWQVARIGRRIMGWPRPPPPKQGAWHHFEMPGARHGYQCENQQFSSRGAAQVENVAGQSRAGKRSLRIAFEVTAGQVACVSTPILPDETAGGYKIEATPRLYSGMRVQLQGLAGKIGGPVELRLFVRHWDETSRKPTGLIHSRAVKVVNSNAAVRLALTIPDLKGWPVKDFGLEIRSANRVAGEFFVDTVTFAGQPQLVYPARLPVENGQVPGWIKYADLIRGRFSDDREDNTHVGKNEGRGILVTGNTDWRDYTFVARVKIHLADKGGILVRYQGLERYLALVKTPDKLQLIRRYYGDQVLAESNCRWHLDEFHQLALTCQGRRITASCDGRNVLEGADDQLRCGGAGMVFENGLIGFRDIKVSG